MENRTVRAVLRGAGLTFACCSAAVSAPNHRFVVTGVQVTDLGTLGGSQGAALDLNDSGQVVGWAATAQGIQHAFLYSNGLMEDVGDAFGPQLSEAAGINSSGRVVGTMTDQFGTIAFLWDAGGVSWLRSFKHEASHATAINDNGDISGYSARASSPSLPDGAGIWFNGGPFKFMAANANANDLNLSGVAVGHAESGYSMMRWTAAGQSIRRDNVPVPGAGYAAGDALAINDRGEIVGHVGFVDSAGISMERAYVWDGVSPSSLDLGVLPSGTNSFAEDLNELEFIAGHANEHIVQPFIDIWRERGFLYHRDFGLYALPALPATTWLGSCRASALNEVNASSVIQVVGSCDIPGGTHAVRWDVTVVQVCVFCRP